ncbi:hypothetical protein P7C71_g2720, partial [Lecanoromycetidae sp. Uapishka_2]
MALVEYSDSEGSDEEEAPAAQGASRSKTDPNKPAFQKVVDRSNPHRIKVSLPETVKNEEKDADEAERPAKRARVGGSGLGGFNALLPAPKRAAVSSGEFLANGARKGGLGSGVNLRTGAAPGFSREPEPLITPVEDGETGITGAETATKSTQDGKGLVEKYKNGDLQLPAKVVEEPKLKGRTTMFKPLSVARKPQKKKAFPKDGLAGDMGIDDEISQQPKPIPKVSLFSVADIDETHSTIQVGTHSRYQPMVYSASEPKAGESSTELQDEENQPEEQYTFTAATQSANGPPQSLDTIASDLNLSASAKRQLLGRQKNNSSAINIMNFNTDEEYKQNELMRQAGEVVQHNAVRAIAPGKHSLKQLVNVASTQKDALEESFASGRRNKKEAGSKYGW